jgi:ABC-2 type transport system permease protein
MALMVVKRYLKIYSLLFRFGFIQSTTYRVGFLVEMLVEFGYQIVFILFFKIIYANIKSIAGWSYDEMLFLVGLNIITSEIFTGAILVFNLRRLPEKIKNGDIDLTLLKPINSLFNLSLGAPYFSSFLSVIPGFYLMIYSQMGKSINILNILIGIFVLSCGLIIAYCVIVIISSLSFLFVNAKTFPEIGESIFYRFTSYPHQIYQGPLKILFFFILPMVFAGGIPASFFIRGVDWPLLFLGMVLTCVFVYLTIKIWNHMIKYYSSASS